MSDYITCDTCKQLYKDCFIVNGNRAEDSTFKGYNNHKIQISSGTLFSIRKACEGQLRKATKEEIQQYEKELEDLKKKELGRVIFTTDGSGNKPAGHLV